MNDKPEHIPYQMSCLQKYRKDHKNHNLKPSFVQWLCTNRRQFHDTNCDNNSPFLTHNELTTEEILQTIDYLPALGCEVFTIIGEDPFLREDIPQVLEYAKKKGMKIGVVTHTYSTEEILQQIEQTGIDSIIVNIDGCRNLHDKIKGEIGAYKKILHNLQYYYTIDIPFIGVSVVAMDENLSDIPKIIEDVYAHGGNRLRIQPLLLKNEKRNSSQTIIKNFQQVYAARQRGFNIEISEGFGYLGPLENRVRSFEFFCGCGWDTFTIMPNGDIMGCPSLHVPNSIEGNIRDNDLPHIWFEGFQQFRGAMVKNLPAHCNDCQYLQLCRGGCWLFRSQGKDPCFLVQAEEVAAQITR